MLYVNVSQVYFARFPEYHDELYSLNQQSDRGLINRAEYIAAVAQITGVSVAATEQAFKKEHVINQPLIDYIGRELKPRYKIGLLTNIGRGWLEDFFDAHQLHELFDAVILSSQEGMTKPNPLLFERAAQRLGLEPTECIMIDDSNENCEGAKRAGMKAILYDKTTTPQKISKQLSI